MVSKKLKMSMGIFVIVAAIAYLMVTGFSGSSSFQVSIQDLISNGEEYNEKYLLVEGKVMRETIQWDGKEIELRFNVTDGDNEMLVIYNDVAPDNLDYEEGAEAILKGTYDYHTQVFLADRVETRCPSKYEAAE